MNGQADIYRQLHYKIVFLTFILGIISLLNACATTPPVTPFRIPDLAYPDTDQKAYLWTSGVRRGFGNLDDFATITRINDVNIPDEYLPPYPWSGPLGTWLLEIPAGEHVIEIVYKEKTVICGYFGCLVSEQSRQTLTFNAEPNQTYSPFVADECAREYFWLEDWGPYTEGSETRRFISAITTDLTKPVVAGEAPNQNNLCE